MSRRDGLLAAALAAFVLILGGWRMAPGVVGAFHDDGVYVATAKALAEGEGYRLINLPGAPPQTKYPILYPAALAAVWTVVPRFPANAVIMQWATLASSALGVAMMFLYLVRWGYLDRQAAWLLVLLCASARMYLYLGAQALSDMPFVVLLVASLWLAEVVAVDSVRPGLRQLLVGAALAMPTLCRAIGAAPLMGLLTVLIVRGHIGKWAVLGAGLVTGAWVAWTVIAPGTFAASSVSGYYTDYSYGYFALMREHGARIVALNALFATLAIPSLEWFGPLESLQAVGMGAAPVGVMFVLGLGAWAGLLVGVRGRRLLSWCGLALLCEVILWPWTPSRFLAPVLPLLIAPAVALVRSRLARFPSSGRRWLNDCLIGAVVAGTAVNVQADVRLAVQNRRTGYPYERLVKPDASAPRQPASWGSYQALFGWIATNTPTSAVIASGLDTMAYLYTGRQGFRPFVYHSEAYYLGNLSPLGPDDEILSQLRRGRADYVVLVPGFAEGQGLDAAIARIRTAHPGLLSPAYQGDDPRFAVLAVNHATIEATAGR